MIAEDIKNLIETGLPDCHAHVAGDGRHFEAIVVSPAFSGKNRVQKQQLVYATLGNTIADGTLHAISIKALTPEEWKNQQIES